MGNDFIHYSKEKGLKLNVTNPINHIFQPENDEQGNFNYFYHPIRGLCLTFSSEKVALLDPDGLRSVILRADFIKGFDMGKKYNKIWKQIEVMYFYVFFLLDSVQQRKKVPLS